jgi:hypothetical protein
MDMSKEIGKKAPDEGPFEDRVFARFDAIDARTRRLENAAKPGGDFSNTDGCG